MVAKKCLVHVLALGLLVNVAAGDAAQAQGGCTEPTFAGLLAKIDSRAETVSQEKTLNSNLFRERDRYLHRASNLTYAATTLAAVGLGVATAAAGTAIGGLYGFLALNASSGGAGLLVTQAAVGNAAVTTVGGAVGGLVTGIVGGPVLLSRSPGGKSQNVTDAGAYERANLPAWSYSDSAALLSSVSFTMESFRNAQLRVGAASMDEASKVKARRRWYHLGWDDKRELEIMVNENEQHYLMYDAEARYLAKTRKTIVATCAELGRSAEAEAALDAARSAERAMQGASIVEDTASKSVMIDSGKIAWPRSDASRQTSAN